jgi:hypothetical protein
MIGFSGGFMDVPIAIWVLICIQIGLNIHAVIIVAP